MRLPRTLRVLAMTVMFDSYIQNQSVKVRIATGMMKLEEYARRQTACDLNKNIQNDKNRSNKQNTGLFDDFQLLIYYIL